MDNLAKLNRSKLNWLYSYQWPSLGHFKHLEYLVPSELSCLLVEVSLLNYIKSTVLMIMFPSWVMEHLQANNQAEREPRTPLFHIYSFLLEYFRGILMARQYKSQGD